MHFLLCQRRDDCAHRVQGLKTQHARQGRAVRRGVRAAAGSKQAIAGAFAAGLLAPTVRLPRPSRVLHRFNRLRRLLGWNVVGTLAYLLRK